MIILYITEENIFVVFICKLSSTISKEEILKHHIKDCFEINGKQKIKMPR